MSDSVIPIVVNCVLREHFGEKRLIQKYDADNENPDFCVHGLLFRKYCDECENYFESTTTDSGSGDEKTSKK